MKTVDYRDYQPVRSSRMRENIEWSITYAYNACDVSSPRILLIGDSICNAYHGNVKEKMSECANVTFWAGSKCVTDRDYFRELDFILDGADFNIIFFNNGLHSLDTNRSEWENAYGRVAAFIADKKPQAHLVLMLCTPLCDPELNATVMGLNASVRAIAKQRSLPILDLYSPMVPLATNEYMCDTYHWKQPAIDKQAELIAVYAKKHINYAVKIVQLGSETGPDGAIL